MRIYIIIITTCLIFFNVMHLEYPTDNSNKYYTDINNDVEIITTDELLEMNSYIESRGEYDVANKYGYVGKYQIGKRLLIDLGYDSTLVKKIKKSIRCIKEKSGDKTIKKYRFKLSLFPPEKQEEVIKKMLEKNEKKYLKKHIEKYVGKEIGGVKITKAGILSASFLGFMHVRKFLSSNGRLNKKDANGHSIKDRLKYFEKYEIK